MKVEKSRAYNSFTQIGRPLMKRSGTNRARFKKQHSILFQRKTKKL